ncbi:MAG: hypothetical protein VW827_04410 [Alphaproteobacteria bacterium]
MKKKNSDIINEVRKSVGPKIKKAVENELSVYLKDKDLIKSTVEEWLEKNAKEITRDILQKEIKNLFK